MKYTQRFESIAVVTAPVTEPISLAEIKANLGIDDDAYDVALIRLRATARQYCEKVQRRAFITQTLDVTYNLPLTRLILPRPPLQSVTSIKYLDTDGVEQTLDSAYYRVTGTDPGLITLAEGYSWPSVQPVEEPVTVRIVAGYGDDQDVPQTTKGAMLALIGHWMENREAALAGQTVTAVPFQLESLITLDRDLYF